MQLPLQARGATMMPRVELTDEGSTYAVQVEVPGFSKVSQ
jgi:HSP20 family molecular chaperone IbpA